MSELLRALTSPETGFPTREWGELFASFWARVRRREVSAAEAAAVAAALTAGLHARSARALLASLVEPPD
ncbi:MAG: hypothetical protein HOY71_33660, partial [Nonomuraea sp.]|nr:hypothetical protein [Nonomuraea sp.]